MILTVLRNALGWILRRVRRSRRLEALRLPQPVTNREVLRRVSLVMLGGRPFAPHREPPFSVGRVPSTTWNHDARARGVRAYFAQHYVGKDGLGNLLSAPVKHGRGALRRQAARASHIRERL